MFTNGLFTEVEQAGLGIESSNGEGWRVVFIADDLVGVSEFWGVVRDAYNYTLFLLEMKTEG